MRVHKAIGSAFISLSREQVATMLNEVFDAIHAEGALAGVYCCGNTDWSVLMETSIDILNRKAQARTVDIPVDDFAPRSLMTTSCGLGLTTIEIADQAMEIFCRNRKDFTARMSQLQLVHA